MAQRASRLQDDGSKLTADQLYGRGNDLRDLGRLVDAVDSYDAALALERGHADALIDRGAVLWMLGRATDGLESLDQGLMLQPGQARGHNLRGLVLVSLGQPDEALSAYDRALAVAPEFSDALGNKGLLLNELGRTEEARAATLQAIDLSPRSARLYYNLTLTGRMRPGDPQLAAMQALAADMINLPKDDQIHLRYALARALDDAGEPAAGFAHLLTGSALKRQAVVYDEAATLAELSRTATVFNATLLNATTGQGHPSAAPIFIVGMPRSGSTLIEQILASHPEAMALGETGAFAKAIEHMKAAPSSADPWRALGEAYFTALPLEARTAACLVDKTLDNFRLIGLLRMALPKARIIHARRSALDTCVSCFTKLFGADLPFTYDLGELGRYWRAYAALMDHWRSVVPPESLLEIDYEALVADLEGQARRILAHCSLDWDPRCLDFHQTERWVHTASATQVRQPLYQGSVDRWKAYAPYLTPLIRGLEGKP